MFRAFHPSRRRAFTAWSTATGARATNTGSRIDLVLAAGIPLRLEPGATLPGAAQRIGRRSCAASLVITGCGISPEVQGSDHCPVTCDLEGELPCASEPPPGSGSLLFSGKQLTLHTWLATGLPGGDITPPAGEPMPGAGLSFGSTDGPVAVGPSRTDSKPASAFPHNVAATVKQASLASFFSAGAAGAVSSRAAAGGAEPGPSGAPRAHEASSFLSAELAAAEEHWQEARTEAREVWQQIQRRMQTPKCQHGEPALMKRVNKSGPNRGALSVGRQAAQGYPCRGLQGA